MCDSLTSSRFRTRPIRASCFPASSRNQPVSTLASHLEEALERHPCLCTPAQVLYAALSSRQARVTRERAAPRTGLQTERRKSRELLGIQVLVLNSHSICSGSFGCVGETYSMVNIVVTGGDALSDVMSTVSNSECCEAEQEDVPSPNNKAKDKEGNEKSSRPTLGKCGENLR